MKEKEDIGKSESTEQKIKEAARKVFTSKGYAATRTRDIAEESGFNLALINYYFRSKEKLFEIIMLDNLQLFMGSIIGILDEPATSLEEKVDLLVTYYVDMLIVNPGIPVFILNLVNNNPEALKEKLDRASLVANSVFVKQFQDLMKKKGMNIHPLHLFMNIISLTVFPFAAAPLIKAKNGIDDEGYKQLMLERKKLIPVWIKTMMVM